MSEVLSQNKLKYITSLHLKKKREEEGVFIAEGIKVINDLVKFGFIPQVMAYNPDVWDLKDFGQSHAFCEYYTTTNVQDGKLSLLSTPPGVMAVFAKPVVEFDDNILKNDVVFLLDNINDPGNLGTIIRTSHWHGIQDIFITEGSCEVYNPKVVQSSMGSLAAVKVHIVNNEEFAANLQASGASIYAADMGGQNVKSAHVNKPACIVFGNEANGISDFWKSQAKMTLTILPTDVDHHPESLNLSISLAIFMQILKGV